MRSRGKFAPAIAWRAFFFGTGLATALPGAAPMSAPPELSQVGKPNEAEAARILEQFRQAGVAGEFFLEFDFRTLPRRGEERTCAGRLWGGRTAHGAAFRLEVDDGAGGTLRLLLRNGVRAGVWRLSDGRAVPLEPAATLAPLVPGVEISAFDLQMPFLYWPDARLERIARVFGRPAYAYHFRAPAEPAAAAGGVAAARAFLDTQFNALMQTELLDASGRVVKTFALISLKKVGGQHIPKQADYRNEATRDKTRFQVRGAALNLRLPAATFEPEQLAAEVARPAPEQIVRIEP